MASSHGSSMRRRASLYTQYADAAQKMTRKKMKTFRIASHVPEWKKSLKPPNRSSFESVVVV
jgi:hypothetical protein